MTATLTHSRSRPGDRGSLRDDSVPSRRIVVAVDGSDASIDALRWTKEVLLRDGDSVCAITGFAPPPCCPEAPASAELVHQSAECARIAAELAIRTAFGVDEPDLGVEHLVSFGSFECLALRESADADLIVIGSPPERGLLGWLRSSGVRRLARYAACPVVSVPVGSYTD